MRQIILIIAVLYSCQSLAASALPIADWWQRGVQNYQQKEYDSAVTYWERIAALNPQNVEVYYNLGNAYYRLNKIGPAVLNYNRALRLSPGNKNATDNLALAEARIVNRIPPVTDIFFITWWHSFTSGTTANIWAIVAWLLLALTIGLLFYKVWKRNNNHLLQRGIGISAAFWGVCLCIAFIAAGNKTAHSKAIIMQADAPFMSNQQGTGKAQAYLPEGTTLQLKTDVGDWIEVILPDGRMGWVQKTWFIKI
jgi:tetratricopeptide (TPR) repeat protein